MVWGTQILDLFQFQLLWKFALQGNLQVLALDQADKLKQLNLWKVCKIELEQMRMLPYKMVKSLFIYSNSKWSTEISEAAEKNEVLCAPLSLVKVRWYLPGLLFKLPEKLCVASKKGSRNKNPILISVLHSDKVKTYLLLQVSTSFTTSFIVVFFLFCPPF